MPKTIYITATRPGDGKTIVTLGLTSAFRKRTDAIGFIKPLGKRRSTKQQHDPDIPLIEKACHVECDTEDMNPVTIHTGFMEEFLQKGREQELIDRVKSSFNRVAEGKDLVVIEGTGHAARGSIFGLSNAFVASTLQSKVLLVTSGGLGPELDEVMLNLSMFRSYGVEVLGIVLNRVSPEEKDLLETIGKQALESRGIKVLGVIPFRQMLETPTILEVLDATDGEVIGSDQEMDNRVGRVVLGDSSPQRLLRDLVPHSVIITSSDRSDIILATLSYSLLAETEAAHVAGLVLCGGTHPEEEILKLIQRSRVPVLLVAQDTYTTASIIRDLRGTIQPNDRGKIELVQDLIARHVETDKIYDAL